MLCDKLSAEMSKYPVSVNGNIESEQLDHATDVFRGSYFNINGLNPRINYFALSLNWKT